MLFKRKRNVTVQQAMYGENYTHLTDRDDWDALNRELFAQIVQRWPRNALALISNYHGGGFDPKNPYLRLSSELDGEFRDLFTGFRMEQFDKIFQLSESYKPDHTDCYRVKNLGLPNNCLAFLIEHRDGRRRSMLIFGGERLKGQLE